MVMTSASHAEDPRFESGQAHITKMKLPPGIRERKRYVIFKVISEEDKRFSKEEILRSCLYAIRSFLGDKGMSDANVYLINWNENLGLGILKTTHKTKDDIVAALSLLSTINETKVSVIPLNTTGTIKKAREIIMYLKSVEKEANKTENKNKTENNV